MSAPELGGKLVEAVESQKYDATIVNFAKSRHGRPFWNARRSDKSRESVDVCLGNLIESVQNQKGALLVTADHGNCEKMWDDVKDEPHTAHTLAQVPIMYADYRERADDGSTTEPKLGDGVLADIAPTMLELLGVEQPASMTGKSLLRKSDVL